MSVNDLKQIIIRLSLRIIFPLSHPFNSFQPMILGIGIYFYFLLLLVWSLTYSLNFAIHSVIVKPSRRLQILPINIVRN